jgi:hypothetical protein
MVTVTDPGRPVATGDDAIRADALIANWLQAEHTIESRGSYAGRDVVIDPPALLSLRGLLIGAFADCASEHYEAGRIDAGAGL